MHCFRYGALALCLPLPTLVATDAHAHGTMTTPASRIYTCFQGNPENPTNPACAAAKAVGGAQPFYDWAGINQAGANGNHQAVVPDGKLCSGGNAHYRGMDLDRSDWQSTPIRANAEGRYTFVFKASAPHATRDWQFYITPEGWQPGSTLRWSDMERFCTLGDTALSPDGTYRLDCPCPRRSGAHVIYNTWQRSDSQEAFYTCMDVRLEGDDGQQPPLWQDAGPLTARGELPAGTTLALRVFNAGGHDVERVESAVAPGQGAAARWPLELGRVVNATAQHARIGVMRDGTITPVASATANRVYLKANHLFQLDVRTPDVPPEEGDFDFVYPDGLGRYVPGQTVVKGSDGKLYACRPFPEGAWCNVNADAYRPGTGSAWRDAWIPY